ncbi:MAG: lysine-sensitive aspartokinase 3 [Planctomycetota bacterium]
MLVMKFGGSSVADADCFRQVTELVAEAAGQQPLVVLSAMGKTTNALFEAAAHAERGDEGAALDRISGVLQLHWETCLDLFEQKVPPSLETHLATLQEELSLFLRGVAMLKELSPRTLDAIVSFGERLSTRIFHAHIERRLPALWCDARQVLRTDSRFGRGRPNRPAIRQLAERHWREPLGQGKILITQGYVGATEDGITTTLGRGGSDYSAALFGEGLGAEEVQIWTDVNGIMTCDPRIVADAHPIARLSFAEAAELAAFGAKVLHPATIQPAVEAHIPVTVRNTKHPDGPYTTVTEEARHERPITALACRGPITVLTVHSSRMLEQPGFLARVFDIFREHQVSVDLVATAEVSISLTVDDTQALPAVCEELRAFSRVEISENRSIIALVGEQLKRTPGLSARIFTALAHINIEMISMGANEINLSLVLQQEDAEEAVRRLHRILLT